MYIKNAKLKYITPIVAEVVTVHFTVVAEDSGSTVRVPGTHWASQVQAAHIKACTKAVSCIEILRLELLIKEEFITKVKSILNDQINLD
ncbi:hypothetical protein J6590_063331 [Homalodisca vitripennis]|nr:hypothetical protein J6590_063331 [Homalodisca vitripennis]